MTLKEQIKILDDKIKQNQAHYDLYRQNAKISALSSGKLDKYEYLTSEDLEYRPDPVQKARFEYSPLGQVFNKGLDSNEKQEGLLKRLKNIEDKTDNQLDLIRDQGDKQLNLISKANTNRTKFQGKRIQELNELKNKIEKKQKEFSKKNLVYTTTSKNRITYNFNAYRYLLDFADDALDTEYVADATALDLVLS